MLLDNMSTGTDLPAQSRSGHPATCRVGER